MISLHLHTGFGEVIGCIVITQILHCGQFHFVYERWGKRPKAGKQHRPAFMDVLHCILWSPFIISRASTYQFPGPLGSFSYIQQLDKNKRQRKEKSLK